MHSQHPAAHKADFLPCGTDSHSVLDTGFTSINSRRTLCGFCSRNTANYCRLVKKWKRELANKPLLTLFPYENQKKAIKNKERGPTSPDTAGRVHSCVQLVFYQRQLAHGHICFRNKAPGAACQQTRLSCHPTAKPENVLCSRGALVSELLNHS